MKKISIIFIILASAFNLFAKSEFRAAAISTPEPFTFCEGHDPHDSLLFEGDDVQPINSHYGDTCVVVVLSSTLKGKVEGMLARDTLELVECGTMALVTKCEWKQLTTKGLLFLCIDDSIVTGPTGSCEVIIAAGYNLPFGIEDEDLDKIKIGPGSVVYPPKCLPYSQVLLKRGKIKVNETKENVQRKIIETYRAVFRPTGTKYSVESGDNGDIIRVYEGSVDITLKSISKNREENAEKDITKLTEDLMSGKLSQEEFEKKIKEFSDDLNVIVTVEAGYQCTITEKFGKVIPIENDDRWWEN